MSADGVYLLQNGAALFIGHIDEYASDAILFDPKTGNIFVDAFCYRPSLSPDRRRLAYIRFFPEHFVTAEESTNRIFVLDLSKKIDPSFYRDRPLGGEMVFSAGSGGYVDCGLHWKGPNRFSFLAWVPRRSHQYVRATETLSNDAATYQLTNVSPLLFTHC